MRWAFTLITIDDDDNVIETIVDEPNGWSGLSMPIIRDQDLHGMGIEFSTNNLQFESEGYWIIKQEYLKHGVDGNVGIRIDWRCDECDGWKVYVDGKLDFRSFKEYCGFDCYVSLGIIDKSFMTMIKDRQDIDVDLTSSVAYDGVTTLTDYATLDGIIQVPSKALHLKAEANFKYDPTIPGSDTYNVAKDADYSSNSNVIQGFIVPKFNNVVTSEIETFSPAASFDYMTFLDDTLDSELDGFEIIKIKPLNIRTVNNLITISFRLKGSFHTKTNTVSSPFGRDVRATLSVGMKYGADRTDAFAPVLIGNYSHHVGFLGIGENTMFFDYSNSVTLSLSENDPVWFYFILETFESGITILSTVFDALEITLDEDSFFKADSISVTEPSPAKIFLIHEALSRTVESITNNQLKVKSQYYGRTDSQPYSFIVDGCDGLLGILNGLNLRRATLQDGTQPKVFTSLKKAFDSLNALDCIGMGVEYGEDLAPYLAIENIHHFYSNEIVFIAEGVNEITRSVKTDRIWNQFNFGFEKFETETTNGLDAIHTKRQYRTPIINTDAKIEKYSSYIFDGYPIEATRRKYGSTEDWRYDQDIFGLCLKRSEAEIYTQFSGNVSITWLSNIAIQVPIVVQNLSVQPGYTLVYDGLEYTITDASFDGSFLDLSVMPNLPNNGTAANKLITIYSNGSPSFEYAVEQGNITSPANIFDPPTVLNYRVSPIHNALRWFKWVMQGVANLFIDGLNETAKLTFNSGVGNYVAEGELSANNCILEKEVLTENETIDLTKFFDPISGTPFIVPETVEFTYPLGLNEFLFIKENMYGLIKWRQDDMDEWHYGWIDRLEPNHEDGDAKFTLVTAVSSDDFTTIVRPDCQGTRAIISSVEPTLTGVVIYGTAYTGTTNDVYGSDTENGVYSLLSANNTADELVHGIDVDNAGTNRYFKIRSYNVGDGCDYGYSDVRAFFCTPEPVITFTDNGDGTITIHVTSTIEGESLQAYGATTSFGTFAAIGSPVIADATGSADISVDATTYTWFEVGATDAVCDYGFSNVINFVYSVCAGGFAPVINGITENGTDIIIQGTSVIDSTIRVFGSETSTGGFLQVGEEAYTYSDLEAGITLTADQYGDNIYFKVYSEDSLCNYGFSNVGGTSVITDENPVFFTNSDELVTIPWTPQRIARYGHHPHFQIWITDSGQPELTGFGMYGDEPWPNTTQYTYRNSGGRGYISIIGMPDSVQTE